jgi:hypothetical protein
MADNETQDLVVSKPHEGDKQWLRAQPIQLVASRERLALSSSTVTVRNTSPNQRHIIIDRNLQGHELAPGQSKKIEMVNTDVDYFHNRRQFGHPVIVEGIPRFEEAAKSTQQSNQGQRK